MASVESKLRRPANGLAPERGGLYIRGLLMDTDDARRKKLKLRAWRRGFREADLILGPFADKHVPSMSEAELDRFERLLEQPDQDLYAWIIGAQPVPAPLDDELMSHLKAFRDEVHAGGARGG